MNLELEWLKIELMEDDACGQMRPLTEYLDKCTTEAERDELKDWYERGYQRCRLFFDELAEEEAECRGLALFSFASVKA